MKWKGLGQSHWPLLSVSLLALCLEILLARKQTSEAHLKLQGLKLPIVLLFLSKLEMTPAAATIAVLKWVILQVPFWHPMLATSLIHCHCVLYSFHCYLVQDLHTKMPTLKMEANSIAVRNRLCRLQDLL